MTELFPMIQPEMAAVSDELPLYRECAWDFEQGQPIFENGAPVQVTGAQAVRVWAWKALMTARRRYEVYSWDFGSELESLVGQPYTDELKRAEAARYVREALEINPYITDVTNVKADFDGGSLTISATLNTIYGEVNLDV